MSTVRRAKRPSQVDQQLLATIADALAAEDVAAERRKRNEGRTAPMFTFCRELRWHPVFAAKFYGITPAECTKLGLTDLTAREAMKVVAQVLEMKFDTRQPWGTAFPEVDDPQGEFVKQWRLIRFPTGIFERAVLLARGRPFPIDSEISEKYDFFLAICWALQELRGEDEIFIPTRTFGKVIGVSPRMISNYIGFAIEEGLLARRAAADREKGRAARFCFSCPEPPQTSQRVSEGYRRGARGVPNDAA